MKGLIENLKTWLSKAFNTAVLVKSRMEWVDYLKGIIIILVVNKHVYAGLEVSGIPVPEMIKKANMVFFSFRMPLFFILSGLFVTSSFGKRGLNKFLSIKFENLIYPYLIWSVIEITLQVMFSGVANAHRSYKDYLRILYNPHVLDHFWYLPALFNTTIIYILLKTKLHLKTWMQLALGFVLYFSAQYVVDVSILSDWMTYYLCFAIGDACSILFFQDSTQRFLKKPAVLLGIITLFVSTQIYYLDHPETFHLLGAVTNLGKLQLVGIALIGSLGMFALAFQLQERKVFRFLRVIGFHSLYIYVMHVMVAAATRIVLARIFGIENAYMLLIVCTITGVTIPIIAYNLLIKDNVLSFLFSYSKNKAMRLKTEPAINPEVSTVKKISLNPVNDVKNICE